MKKISHSKKVNIQKLDKQQMKSIKGGNRRKSVSRKAGVD